MLRLLRRFLLRYRGLLLAIIVFQAIQTGFQLVIPALNADLIDNGVLTGDTAYIWRAGFVMLGATLGQVVFAIVATYFGAKAAMAFSRDVRNELFEHVTLFASADVNQFGSASLITRVTNDVQQMQITVVTLCTVSISAPVMVVGGTVMAFREDGALSLILVVGMAILLFFTGILISAQLPLYEVVQAGIDRVNQVLREQITGMRVVRAFVREPEQGRRFAEANGALTTTELRVFRIQAFFFPMVMVVLNLSTIAAVWVGGARIDTGEMQVGGLIAFLTYLFLILNAAMMATFVAVTWPRASVCARRVCATLDAEPTVHEPTTAMTELPLRATLEFRQVSFGYPHAEAPVLSDVSFKVVPGQTLAVVGSTGAGKSTLVNLAPRLYDATGGTVLVNGVDVRDLPMEMLWSHIGLVPQRPYLFTGTVASNLRYGNADATDDELWDALTIAQAQDFVEAMPLGLDSPIAQGGTNVSGGQRQRLAIARALVKRPDIYLFDDSFSALDLATDARLRAALAPVVGNAAVVIVAQRISTVLTADQILVIEGGTTVGLGTHEQLLEVCPTYVEIVESQIGQAAP